MSRATRLEAILDAGARVLGERGEYGTTMRDVAAEAGVGLATLYHYVGGRDDLVYQVAVRILTAAEASARATFARKGARERLKALVADHVRRVLDQPVVAAIVAGRFDSLGGERARRLEALRVDYVEGVRTALEDALRRSGPRGRPSEERVAMLLGMADRLALDAATRGTTPAPGRLAGRIVQTFLEGVLPRR